MLGFAMRAGKIDTGTDIVCSLLPKGIVKLVIISSDASNGTRKKIRNKCDFYGVDYVESEFDSDRLSASIGKMSATVCIAIKDEGFKAEILGTFS
jgi:ribosomal protein L7Ae-like RNA K-turn-binding protein